MSLLNFSVSRSAMKSDIFNYHAAENSNNFKEYNSFEDFERYIKSNIGKLSAEIDHFDEEKADNDQLKKFMKNCSRKLSEMKTILDALKEEPELLQEVPDGFLRTNDEKIQKIKRKLQLKKLCPDGITELSLSKTLEGSKYDEECISLLNGREENPDEFDSKGIKRIDCESDKMKKKRLKGIESKYEYINLICNDLNSLATDQKICIESLNTNYSKALDNIKGGTGQLEKLNEFKQKRSKRNCVVFLVGILMMIFTFLYFKMVTTINF